MHPLFLNILLALMWVAMTGRFTGSNLLAGFVLGFVILLFSRRALGSVGYFPKYWKTIGLFGFFLIELIKSNLRVAYDVVTPRHRMRPGIIAVPLDARTDAEITLLANLLTLTPGTLSIDVSDDRKVLYMHAMYIHEDPEAVRRSIKDGFERRILEVLR